MYWCVDVLICFLIYVEATVVNEFESMKADIGNIESTTSALSLPDYIKKMENFGMIKNIFDHNEKKISFLQNIFNSRNFF